MKYIRTKDGKIFDVSEICVPYQIIESCIDFNSQGRFEIIKQANTINLLCDRFVVDFENGEEPLAFKNYLDTLKYFGKAKIYGAIWTDKGLIYVAKLNDKGELELL